MVEALSSPVPGSAKSRSGRRGQGSGRVWRSPGGEDETMITAMGLGGGGGGKGGGGEGGGRTDLTMVLMEEQIQEMQRTITAMKQQIDGLKAENKSLKEQQTHNPAYDKDDKGAWGQDQGKWRAGGRGDVDPWKDWNGRDKAWRGDEEMVNDEGKWKQTVERDVKDERTTRGWVGGRIDRRNEMVAMGV